MTERFIRCTHCGLPHDAQVSVCPTTGLRIKHDDTARRRKRGIVRQRTEQPELILGWIIDAKYRLKSVIGQGGMSAIYEAEELSTQRRVALKVLHPSLSDDREAIARLRREAEVVSAIGHQNICAVFDTGRAADGSPYLVMERLFGESLAERIRALGPRPFSELAPLICQVLAALQAAHDKSILHRDLKPENVFVEQPDSATLRAKLLDFGISKSMGADFTHQQRLTHTGMVMGTPYYMAPEQARGDSGLDHRVDLWAVGVMLYEGLSGKRPFVASNYNALLVKILTSKPTPIAEVMPSLPVEVTDIVDKALRKEPNERFQSARAFSDAINVVLAQLTSEEAPTALQMNAWRAPGGRDLAMTRKEAAPQWRDGRVERAARDTDVVPDDDEGGEDTEVIDRSELASLATRDMADTTEDHAVHLDTGANPIESSRGWRRSKPSYDAPRYDRPSSTGMPSSARDTEVIRRDEHTGLRQLIAKARTEASAAANTAAGGAPVPAPGPPAAPRARTHTPAPVPPVPAPLASGPPVPTPLAPGALGPAPATPASPRARAHTPAPTPPAPAAPTPTGHAAPGLAPGAARQELPSSPPHAGPHEPMGTPGPPGTPRSRVLTPAPDAAVFHGVAPAPTAPGPAAHGLMAAPHGSTSTPAAGSGVTAPRTAAPAPIAPAPPVPAPPVPPAPPTPLAARTRSAPPVPPAPPALFPGRAPVAPAPSGGPSASAAPPAAPAPKRAVTARPRSPEGSAAPPPPSRPRPPRSSPPSRPAPSRPSPSRPSPPSRPSGQRPPPPSRPSPSRPARPRSSPPSRPAPSRPSPSRPVSSRPSPSRPSPSRPARPRSSPPSRPAPSRPAPSRPARPRSSPPSRPAPPGRSRPAPPRPNRPRKPLSAAPSPIGSTPPAKGLRRAPILKRRAKALAAPRVPPIGGASSPARPPEQASPTADAAPALPQLPDLLDETGSDEEATTVYDAAAARKRLAGRYEPGAPAASEDDGGFGQEQ